MSASYLLTAKCDAPRLSTLTVLYNHMGSCLKMLLQLPHINSNTVCGHEASCGHPEGPWSAACWESHTYLGNLHVSQRSPNPRGLRCSPCLLCFLLRDERASSWTFRRPYGFLSAAYRLPLPKPRDADLTLPFSATADLGALGPLQGSYRCWKTFNTHLLVWFKGYK